MTITEPARHRLYDKLEGLLGMDDAATLMAHLPPVGWADVATRADLDQLHDRINIDLADLRTDMASLETSLRTDMASLEISLNQGLADIRVEMANFRTDIGRELALGREQQHRDRLAALRQLVFVILAAMLSLLAAVAIAR